MSEEKKGELVEIPSTDLQKWEIAEMVDEAIAMGNSSPYMKNEFMYEFRQGGQIVRDLTAPMYKHLALNEGIKMLKDETQFETTDGWYECRVLAQYTHPMTKEVHESEGFGARPLPDEGDANYEKVRKFIKQTVYSIAVRNAVKALLPFDVVVGAINALASGTKDGTVPTARYRQQEPPTPRKLAFAEFKKREQALLNLGVDFNTFWIGVQSAFNVEASDDITDEQWAILADDLKSNAGEITQTIIDEATREEEAVDTEVVDEDEAYSDGGVAEESAEGGESEAGVDDIPF